MGISAQIGDTLNEAEIGKLTDVMADAIIGKLQISQTNKNFLLLSTEQQEHKPLMREIDAVCFFRRHRQAGL